MHFEHKQIFQSATRKSFIKVGSHTSSSVFQIAAPIAMALRACHEFIQLLGTSDGGGHFQSKNSCCRFLTFIQGFKKGLFGKKLHYDFPKMKGGRVNHRLDFFSRNFIRFVAVTHPTKKENVSV